MTSTGDTTRAPVVVIGAGPAGIAAALAASRTTPTILLDEQASPGGHRRWWPDHETDVSDVMQSTLLDAGIDYRPNTSVWALFEGPTVAAYDDRHAFSIDAGSVVIATGSIDRAWPLPGWQLDGVCTAEAVLRDIENGRLTAGTRVGVVGDDAEAFPLIAAIGRAGGTVALHAPDISSARIGGERPGRRHLTIQLAQSPWIAWCWRSVAVPIRPWRSWRAPRACSIARRLSRCRCWTRTARPRFRAST